MSSSTFGIAIPSYKRPDMLARLLDSIDSDWAITVSDNGAHLDKAFKARYPRVNFLVQPTVVSMWENWNLAARGSATDWVVLPGDDDLYYPGAFALIERTLRHHPDADIVLFGHHIIDENDRVIDTWQPELAALQAPDGFHRLRRGVPARPPGIAFRRTLFDRLDGFCENFGLAAGDNDFYQRAALIGRTVLVPEVVCGYRVWTSAGTTLTIASNAWLDDVDLWTGRVQSFASAHTSYHYPDSLRDDIYMGNLRSGIKALKQQGQYRAAWRHAMSARYPLRAQPLSHLKMLVQLLLPANS